MNIKLTISFIFLLLLICNSCTRKQVEFSHFNAIYEIPKNALEKKWPYMKAGNLVVTLNGLGGVGIFDPELKRIEHYVLILKTSVMGLHDGQILPNVEIERSGKIVMQKHNDTLDQKMLKPIYMYRARKTNLDSFFNNNSSGVFINAK